MPRQDQGSVAIELIVADIMTVEADALVLPTTTTGALTSRLGRRIAEMGDQGIEALAMDVAPIAIGAAFISEGGPTPFDAIIHVPVALTPTDRIRVENIRRATRAAMVAGRHAEYSILAIPPLCSPVDTGIPYIEIARAMIDEFRAHKDALPETMRYVLPNEEMLEAAKKILNSIK